MSDGYATPDALLDAGWSLLERGVVDAASPARQMVLASVGLAGDARARIVVLRQADRAAGVIEVQTDTASAKVAELRANPSASFLVWDPAAALQLRLSVRVDILTGADVDSAWDRIPPDARLAYGGAPGPGRPLTDPADHYPAADRNRFAVLRAHIQRIDALHLDAEGHRRATFARDSGFTGLWVAP